MIDDFGQIDSTVSHDQNLADWAQDSPSGTVTEFSNPHVHNNGTYGFDSYEHDSTGKQINRTDGHQLDGSGQRSLRDYEVEQVPLISGKLDQQAQTQFGGVDSFQQGLNQF
jgi:hypothetical protein